MVLGGAPREQHSRFGMHRQNIVTMGFLEQRTSRHIVGQDSSEQDRSEQDAVERWICLKTFP